jgi:hypothetical protein
MGGDLGSSKDQSASSTQKDNRVTGGESAYGGEGNIITVGSDDVAKTSLETVKDVVNAELGNRMAERSLDTDILKVFAQQNTNLQDSTSQRLFDLAQTKVTDGANLNQKTTIIAIAVFGGVLLLPQLSKLTRSFK